MQRLMVQYTAQTVHRRLFDMYVQLRAARDLTKNQAYRATHHNLVIGVWMSTRNLDTCDGVDVVTCACSATTNIITNDTRTRRRRSLPDGIVTVCQRVHAVVQYIPLVVERAQAQLIHFHGVYYVVCRSKYPEFCAGAPGSVSQDIQKLLVTNMFLHIVFLDALCLLLTFGRSPGSPQTIHFCPQPHKFLRCRRPRLALELPQHSSIGLRVQRSEEHTSELQSR